MEIDAEPSDPASAVLAELQENANQIGTAALLTAFGVGFLLVFIGHLRVRLRDGCSGWAADVPGGRTGARCRVDRAVGRSGHPALRLG